MPKSFYSPYLLWLLCCLLTSCVTEDSPTDRPKSVLPYEESAVSISDLRKAAEQGNPEAQNRLGTLYSEGRGVPQDYSRAKQWFDKAAEQGHPGAQVNLGTLYFQGNGAPESEQMALSWFRRAAAQGDALAFAKLGLMYEQGRGVPQDFIQAHMWYNLSAAHGEKRALERRDALTRQMTPAQIAEAQRLAREWTPKQK
ncbi:MAG: tetratricopeptide repeat protein [Nitrospira sp.]|nr:tetratricopeptide repeat protein [Nitrospira sp.]